MFINMFAFSDYFYGTVCHVCKRCGNEDNVILKVCSNCKLFSYCSLEHQKDHWPIHKEFCKCIQAILKRTGGQHVFQEAKELMITDHIEWNNYKINLIQLAECILKRSLTALEQQVFLFPPVCNICYHYEPTQMIPCSLCNSVTYCSQDHKELDFFHKNVCNILKLSFDIDKYISKYHSVSPYPNVTTSIQNLYTSLPENMDMFVKNYASISGTKTLVNTCLASEILSCPLTVLHIFERAYGRECATKKSLILHLVGADILELCAMKTWEILFHWLPSLKYLHLVYIGPGLLNSDNLKPRLCSSCDQSRKFKMDFKPNLLYNDYVNSNECYIPDIIVAFNCGLCEFEKTPEKDLWKSSVPSLLHFPSSIVIITAYCKEECDSDTLRVFKMKKDNADIKILIKGEKNPFSSLSPRRDWESKQESDSAVFYINNYLSVIQT
uniref:MYND-type domain-containing protein n=1 Tax=Clastoptera arizonana TaxID=38151 RepID=A0A1B6E0F3_9HEMI